MVSDKPRVLVEVGGKCVVATVPLEGVCLPMVTIEFEIDYNMYRMKRRLSLGPPYNAIQETCKLGLDSGPPNPTSPRVVGVFHPPPPRGVCCAWWWQRAVGGVCRCTVRSRGEWLCGILCDI
jgi:hypothetical protein